MSHSRPSPIEWQEAQHEDPGTPTTWYAPVSQLTIKHKPASSRPYHLYNRYGLYICAYNTLPFAQLQAAWMLELHSLDLDITPKSYNPNCPQGDDK